MAKREKILLALMGLAIVFGAIMTLAPGDKKDGPAGGGVAAPDLAALNGTVAAMTAKAASYAPGETSLAVLAAATAPWRGNALFRGTLAEKKEDKPEEKPEERLPRYTGYMELGSQRLAIIDGIEYMVGDELESGKFTVASIAADAVVLRYKDQREEVTIPYQEQAPEVR